MRFAVASLSVALAISSTSAVASPVPGPDAHANVDTLVGWPAGPAVVRERAFEDRFIALPTAEKALAIDTTLSSVPHRAGSPADYATSTYVADRLRADGFDVDVVPFEVLYTAPVMQALELTAPQPHAFDLLEGNPQHHTPAEIAAGPAFMENSGDGDVTGPLFYLNHGSVDDWTAFDELGVAMPRGAIVIERLGGATRDPFAGAKNYEQLQQRGVAGLIVYADPMDDGVYGGDAWPAGNWKNAYMAERIGGPKPGVGAIAPPGDPTLPGRAPLPGLKHLTWEQTDHATIPEMNVTQAVARTLLAGMTGPVVPEGWHGGFEMVERVGGNESVRLAVKMERKLVTIWNVIGTLRGATKPDQAVMIGSHRDAMAFGAIDPGSGTTVLLQVADGFKALRDAGWKPARSIEMASWDGHELGLYGSLSLAYARGPQLRKSIVQYVNTDQLTTGSPFVGTMSPELWSFGREIANYVRGADGRPLLAADTEKKPVFVPPGGGSDHMTFIYALGVPGSSAGYYGHFGAHHSAEDNLEGLKTYDPGMRQAVAAAQFTGVQAMRAAGALEMPLRLADVPARMLKDIDAAKKLPQFERVDFAPLAAKANAYLEVARAFDVRLAAAERTGDARVMEPLERKAMVARDAFWMPDGLSYNAFWHTIDRFVTPFPEVNFAAFETTGRDAKVARALARLETAVARATETLRAS